MQHFLDRFFSLEVDLVLCTKFGQSVLRKIIKIVATRCHILGLKCTKFDFGWGSGGRGREGRGEANGNRRGEEGRIRHCMSPQPWREIDANVCMPMFLAI